METTGLQWQLGHESTEQEGMLVIGVKQWVLSAHLARIAQVSAMAGSCEQHWHKVAVWGLLHARQCKEKRQCKNPKQSAGSHSACMQKEACWHNFGQCITALPHDNMDVC
jgi:hypothetical protein